MDVTLPSSIRASIVVHRKAFHYAIRSWDESIETWYKRLNTLADSCSFGDAREIFLLNKFVVDLKEDSGEQINGIDMLHNEWSFQLLDTMFKGHIYSEEYVYQVKDKVTHKTEDVYDDTEYCDWDAVRTLDEVQCAHQTLTVVQKKREPKRDTQPAPAPVESTEENYKEPDLDAPKPKRRQNRKPLKLFCESCPERNFKYKSNLLQHMHRYHIKSKSHVCHYCGKTFNVSMELNKHIRTHTGERPFPCDMCPKRFARSDKLKQHRDVHLGIKAHVCHLCNKRYSQAYSLTLHFRSHTGERPYPCKFCEKAYTNAKSLTIHLKTHGIAS